MSQAPNKMTDDEIKQEFIRLSPDRHTLQVTTISWNGHEPHGKWTNVAKIPQGSTKGDVDSLINQVLADSKYFARCQKCQELNPRGWMHDDTICQSCAVEHLGVVY